MHSRELLNKIATEAGYLTTREMDKLALSNVSAAIISAVAELAAPKKILAQTQARVDELKKKYGPCLECGGEGTRPIPNSYLGDVEKQHDVCSECAGTGSPLGKKWANMDADMANAKRILENEFRALANAKKEHADELEQAAIAREQLKGIAVREKALAEKEARLERATADREAALKQFEAQLNMREKDIDKLTEVLEKRSAELNARRGAYEEAKRASAAQLLDAFETRFKKPLNNLADEIAALRRKL